MTKPVKTSARRKPLEAYRVNARFDAPSRQKLRDLEKRTGLSTSDVVREAIDQMYATHVGAAKDNRGLDDLVGKYSGGPPDLARSYKKYFGDGIAEKHGKR